VAVNGADGVVMSLSGKTEVVVHRPGKAKRRLERHQVAATGLAIVVNPEKRVVS
jgi:hypothetical protein